MLVVGEFAFSVLRSLLSFGKRVFSVLRGGIRVVKRASRVLVCLSALLPFTRMLDSFLVLRFPVFGGQLVSTTVSTVISALLDIFSVFISHV